MSTIGELYDEAGVCYARYVEAQSGDDGHSRSSAISPKRVRERRAEWEAAIDRLRAAGGDVKTVRAMLQERGATGAGKRRKA